MAYSSINPRREREGWQDRMEALRGPAYSNADPRMVVEPYADPGNVLPNTQYPTQPQQNAMEIQDIWRVGGQNALTPQLMQLLMSRPDLLQRYIRQNRLMVTP